MSCRQRRRGICEWLLTTGSCSCDKFSARQTSHTVIPYACIIVPTLHANHSKSNRRIVSPRHLRRLTWSSTRWALIVLVPGIVSEVTKHVVDHGGNVGESQAAKLGHYFSLMMLCSVPTPHYESFQKSMSDLKNMNATIFVADPDATATTRVRPAIGYSGTVHLEGANQPGIVHQVTATLAANGLSIDRLATGEEIAPHGGTTLFHMQCLATAQEPLAKDFDVETIRAQLEALGERLNCDVTLEDVQDDSIGASFVGG